MPDKHQIFLQQVKSIGNIRDFAAKSSIPEVAELGRQAAGQACSANRKSNERFGRYICRLEEHFGKAGLHYLRRFDSMRQWNTRCIASHKSK